MELYRESLRQERLWDGLFSFSEWFSSWRRADRPRVARPRRKRSCVLQLEQLEPRQMPSALSGITEYTIPTASAGAQYLTVGSDGNIWGNENNTQKIFKLSTSGTFTEYTNTGWEAMDITAGPDSNIWFTETATMLGWGVGKSTTSGSITNYSFMGSEPFASINSTLGPDGKIWFTDTNNNKIDKINTDGTGLTQYSIPTTTSNPQGITTGPDGNLWFTEEGGNRIGRITPSGTITEFLVPTASSQPYRIAAGPDGNLYFTEKNGNNIGVISLSGDITEYSIPTSSSAPEGICAGPDGNVWFVENSGNQLGRITPQGTITEFTGLSASGGRPTSSWAAIITSGSPKPGPTRSASLAGG